MVMQHSHFCGSIVGLVRCSYVAKSKWVSNRSLITTPLGRLRFLAWL